MFTTSDSSIKTSYELNISVHFSIRTCPFKTHNKNVAVLRFQLTAERKSENRNRYHPNTHCPPPIFLQTQLLTATDLPGSAVLFSITD